MNAGDIVRGQYRVIDPKGFAGTLPTAVILFPPNAGITVILTDRQRPEVRPE